jgi:hypothetical protein
MPWKRDAGQSVLPRIIARRAEGVPVSDLPADPPAPVMPALQVLQDGTGSTARDGADFLSQLLFYSAAISAAQIVPFYAQLAAAARRYLSHLAGGSQIAGDLLQDTFLQMHRSRAAYNPAYAVRHGCSVWRETLS